jgi:protein phosphatase
MTAPLIYSDEAVVERSERDEVQASARGSALAVRSYGQTDRGKVRPSNQDQFLIASLAKALEVRRASLSEPHIRYGNDPWHLFVVADGMGGHAGGEQASALAIHEVESFVLNTFSAFTRHRVRGRDRILGDFRRALGHANARILAVGAAHPQWRGMGTTLTLAFSLGDELFVAHVGDSRCYLCRDRSLYRLTSDHTLVEELVRRGGLSAEEAATHPWRHMIINVVGGDSAELKVELHRLQLEAGDTVMVCSDGLTNMIAEGEICDTLVQVPGPEQACGRLVARANEMGGQDNITVIVACYEPAAKEE